MHGTISQGFYFPAHRRCRCRLNHIYPGQSGFPFVDFTAVFSDLSKQKQSTAVGKSVSDLINANLIKPEDAVSPSRVKTLEEIVRDKSLTVQDLIAAGIDPIIAAAAVEASKSPEAIKTAHEAAIAKKLSQSANPSVSREPPGNPPAEPQELVSGAPRQSPADAIAAGNSVLSRLAGEPLRMPDYVVDPKSLQGWMHSKFTPEYIATLSHVDWAVLFAAVVAREELKKMFKRLGVDERKAMEAVAR